MDRNNAFANQNLNAIGSSLKDIVINDFTNGQTAVANIGTTDRVGNLL